MIVFIHGYGMDSKIWDSVRPSFHSDSLFLDINPYIEKGLSIRSIATELSIFLETQGEDIILVGHSMGGYIASEIVLNNIELYKGLVLVNSHVFADSHDKKKERQKQIDFIIKNGSQKYLRSFFPKLFYGRIATDIQPLIKNYIENISEEVLVKGQEAMIHRRDCVKVLDLIPVLILHGEQDRLIPIEFLYKMGSHICKGRLIKDQISGHMTMVENRVLFAECLQEFKLHSL